MLAGRGAPGPGGCACSAPRPQLGVGFVRLRSHLRGPRSSGASPPPPSPLWRDLGRLGTAGRGLSWAGGPTGAGPGGPGAPPRLPGLGLVGTGSPGRGAHPGSQSGCPAAAGPGRLRGAASDGGSGASWARRAPSTPGPARLAGGRRRGPVLSRWPAPPLWARICQRPERGARESSFLPERCAPGSKGRGWGPRVRGTGEQASCHPSGSSPCRLPPGLRLRPLPPTLRGRPCAAAGAEGGCGAERRRLFPSLPLSCLLVPSAPARGLWGSQLSV